MQTAQHHLATGQVQTLAGGAALDLQVLKGTVWVTQSGDTRDYFLGPGQTMPLGTARVVVQAEGDCEAVFVVRQAHPLPSTPQRHAPTCAAAGGLSSPSA